MQRGRQTGIHLCSCCVVRFCSSCCRSIGPRAVARYCYQHNTITPYCSMDGSHTSAPAAPGVAAASAASQPGCPAAARHRNTTIAQSMIHVSRTCAPAVWAAAAAPAASQQGPLAAVLPALLTRPAALLLHAAQLQPPHARYKLTMRKSSSITERVRLHCRAEMRCARHRVAHLLPPHARGALA